MTDKKPTLKGDKKVEDKKTVTTSSFVDKKESSQLSTEVQKEEKLVSSKHANENKTSKSAVNKVHNVKKVNFMFKLYYTFRVYLFGYIYILYKVTKLSYK